MRSCIIAQAEATGRMDTYKTYYRDAKNSFHQKEDEVKVCKEWMEEGGDAKPMLLPDGTPLQGVMPSGKPVFEAFYNSINKCIEDPNGGTRLIETDDCIVIIPAGFRKAKTWNTMNPCRYEIGGESTLQSLLHVLVIPKVRIDSPLSLQKEHIPLLNKMRETGRVALEILYEGNYKSVGSLNWVLSQDDVIKLEDKMISTRVKPEDLSANREIPLSMDTEGKMKTVKESFHVDTFSVRYLHLHVYSDEWRTVAYDKLESDAEAVGKKKNIPLDAVLEVLQEE